MKDLDLGTTTMTKADLVAKVYETIGFSKKESSVLVEVVFDLLKNKLIEGQNIKISGFGKFVVQSKKERVGRNPQTGEVITISARRALKFHPSHVLKAMLKGEDFSQLNEDEYDEEVEFDE